MEKVKTKLKGEVVQGEIVLGNVNEKKGKKKK